MTLVRFFVGVVMGLYLWYGLGIEGWDYFAVIATWLPIEVLAHSHGKRLGREEIA